MILTIFAALVYFLPTAVAWMTGCRNHVAVLVVNLFFGWTVVGWVAALVMAVWR